MSLTSIRSAHAPSPLPPFRLTLFLIDAAVLPPIYGRRRRALPDALHSTSRRDRPVDARGPSCEWTLALLLVSNAVLILSQQAPEKRTAQRILADEVTELVHGRESPSRLSEVSCLADSRRSAAFGLERAQTLTSLLYATDLSSLTTSQVLAALPPGSTELLPQRQAALPLSLTTFLAEHKLAPSRTRARQLIKDGAVHLNGIKVTDVDATLAAADLLDGGGFAVLRVGKSLNRVIVIEKEEGVSLPEGAA